jgi:ferric-dicitrate binding protein FerR (iron transport regulator)
MQIPYSACAALCISAIFAGWPAHAQTVHSISGCQILPANNVWNMRVDNLPVDPYSTTYVNSTGANSPLFPDFWSNVSGLFINVVDASQPRVPVTVSYAAEADPGPFPIPANALVQQASDAHLVVLDSGNCMLYEMWQATPNPDGSWNAGSAAVFNLKSNTERPPNWTAADAAGMAMLPGLVTYDEVMSGQITHAIGMTVPYTQQQFIWPARHWASYVSGGQFPHMGQRFRLKAGFDVSPYPFEVQVILNALKKYGAIVEDNGAAWFFSGVQDPRWNNTNLHTLTQVMGSNMEVVDESALMAEANSQAAAGTALALDSIYIDQRQVSAGATVNAEAILTAPAPAGGATVALSISSPGVLGVPASVTIPAGAVSAPIAVTVNNIGLTTPVVFAGSYQGVTVQSPVLLVNGTTGIAAPRLSAFQVTPTTTAGGTSVTATITLTSAAVAGGTAVSLSSSNGVLPVPSTVTVPAGALTATVTLPAESTSANITANLTASLFGESRSVLVTVTPGTGTTPPPTSGVSVAVNAGGTAYTDGSGQVWSADNGYSGGSTAQTSASIAGTSSPALYQTCRWGAFGYSFPVANGSYTVTLRFAEIYFTTAGSRVFNVAINGTTVLSNFDITAQAGAFTALDKSFPVTVTNGQIAIQFSQGSANWPLVSAISIASAGTTTPPPPPAATTLINAGGAAYTDSSGQTWSADNGYSGGSTAQTSASIAGTSSPALYQTCRWGVFGYSLPVANGSYTVTLKFAEIYFTTAGSRVFNVAIDGTTVLSNFDITAQAGAFTALDKSFPVTVTNGQIAIQFSQGSANWPLVSAISIAPSTTTGTTAYDRINAGGAGYTDAAGHVWSSDSSYSGGSTAQTTANIGGTSSPAIYQTCRWGAFTYTFPVPNGNYTVNLKFAEIYFTSPGSRMFNVAINGTTVLSNFDITAQAGALTALDKSFPVSVTNGQIAIQFSQGAADWPLVSGIEVLGQ